MQSFFGTILFLWMGVFAAPPVLGQEASGAAAVGEAKAKASADAKDFADQPYVLELLRNKVRFEADGRGQRETSLRVRVQSESAVKDFGLLVYPYMASFESLELLYARVRKPDGTVVETPASEVQELDSAVSREAPMYTDQREKHIAIKSLGIGDVLEVSLRWNTHDALAPGHFWYDDNYFQAGICLDEEIEINVPASVPVKLGGSGAAGGEPSIKEEVGRRIYTFRSSHLKKEQEDEIPAWEKNAHGAAPPQIRISSFGSWADVGAWYGGLQQARVAVTPGIRTKAQELIQGKSSEAEKTRAIYDFVATRIRYIGIDLGAGRYTPHTAEEVLGNRYGDCKDKHTLFAALLDAAGIKAYPVLISSGYKIDERMPSASLFDHVITAIPQGDGYLFLDTTPEVAPFGLLLHGLRDHEALVIPANGVPKLVRTPGDAPFPMTEKYQMDAAIQMNGTLDGKARLEDRGDVEVLVRAAYRNTPQNRWKDLAQNMVARMGFAGTVSDVAVAQPENTTEPFWFSYSYHRTDYSDWKGHHRITLPFPPFLLPELTEKQKLSREPLPVGSAQDVVYESSLKLPDGVTAMLPSKVERRTDFAEYTATYTIEKGVVHGSRHLVIKLREVPGAERAAWSAFVREVVDDENRYIVLLGDFAMKGTIEKSRTLLRHGKTAEAVELLEKAVAENPEDAQLKLSLGGAYLRVPEEDKAMRLFHEMLGEKPDPGMLGAVALELARANRRISDAMEYAMRGVAETEAKTMNATLDSASMTDYALMGGLALQWDTLGLAKLRAGDTASAAKYIEAAWMLWQRAPIGEHLVEIYEKQGKKQEAARISGMAMAAPGKEDDADTTEKLEAAQKRLVGGKVETMTINGKTVPRPGPGGMELSELRSVKVPRQFELHGEVRTATLAIAIENGQKTPQIRFVDGDEKLRPVIKALTGAKFHQPFPDDAPTRIIRQGFVSCSRYTNDCTFVFFPQENGVLPVRAE